MSKIQIRVSIEAELVREARELGIHLPRTCERAIRRRVAAIRALEGIDDVEGL